LGIYQAQIKPKIVKKWDEYLERLKPLAIFPIQLFFYQGNPRPTSKPIIIGKIFKIWRNNGILCVQQRNHF